MLALTIRPPQSTTELSAAAQLMAGSEPWITLQRDIATIYQSMVHPDKELLVATHMDQLVGLVVINMHGVLAGYIQSLCVAEAWRGRGIGGALLAAAEERILRDAPNVFLLVSAFNDGARRLYERAGYQHVGTLPDFVVRGHAELVLRKSVAPIAEFPQRSQGTGDGPGPIDRAARRG